MVRNIPPTYLRDDRKWRIIDNDTIVRIFVSLIIATWVERTHDHPVFNINVITEPSKYCVINGLRGVAVIRCLLRLELIDETVIILKNLFPISAGSSVSDVFVNVE